MVAAHLGANLTCCQVVDGIEEYGDRLTLAAGIRRLASLRSVTPKVLEAVRQVSSEADLRAWKIPGLSPYQMGNVLAIGLLGRGWLPISVLADAGLPLGRVSKS